MRFSTLLLLSGILVGCCLPSILAKKNVVCYMAAWSIFRPGEGKFTVLDAETDHCTHVVYAFMGLDEYTNEMISIDRSIDGPGGNDQLSKLKLLKERNPDLKIQVSIGGYNEKGKKFSYLAADPERREQFIESVVRFLEKYELDGLDICWQFPGLRGGRPIDKQNAVTLFQEIKTAFIPKGYLLTLHILGKPYIIDEYNIKAVADIVDFINLVCVEYSGPWERTTGVMAPLDSKNKNNVRFAVNYIKLKGAPPNKVNLGLPLYGHAYVLDEEPKEDKLLGLFSNKTFQGPWTAEWGITAFSETCHKFRYVEGWKEVWDEESKTPLAYNGKMFMSFDNEKSLRLKADLVEEKALAGVAFWSLDMDDFRGLCFGKKYPMISAISEYMNRKSSLQATPFTPTHEPPMQTTSATEPPAGEVINYTERNETVEVDYISVTTEDSGENEILPLHRNRTIRSHSDSPKVVVCYIAEWSASRSGLGKFSISDADTEHCTHIIYAFVTIDESTNKIKTIGIQANSDISKLKELKAKNPTIKTSVSIGGWNQGSTRFSEMASTPEKRKTFIKSVVEFIKIHELNGIDMCWQFPTQRGGKPEDKLNSLKLFKELKSAFQPKGWILTVHVLGQKYIVDSYDIKAVSETVDYINFAAVEYHGPWEKIVNPTTPLTSSDESNVKFNVDYILQQGVSPNKVLLGLPTYGHAYSLAEDVRGKLVGIYYDHAVTSQWTKEPGLIAYNEICYEMTNNGGWDTEFEEHSQTPFSYFQQQLATYDNEKSLRLKAKLVRDKNLAGVMIWSLDMDDFRGLCHEGRKYPLVTSVTEYINRPNIIKIKTTEAPIPPTPPPLKTDENNGTQIVSFAYGEH